MRPKCMLTERTAEHSSSFLLAENIEYPNMKLSNNANAIGAYEYLQIQHVTSSLFHVICEDFECRKFGA